jgi:hypothetical protein
MANQMIALQARNPQLPDPARQTAQMANMMNMATQQRAAQLQGERTRQEMAFEAAKEARAAETQTSTQKEAALTYLKNLTQQFKDRLATISPTDKARYGILRQEIVAAIPPFENELPLPDEWNKDSKFLTISKADDVIKYSKATPTTETIFGPDNKIYVAEKGGLNEGLRPLLNTQPVGAPEETLRATPTAPQASAMERGPAAASDAAMTFGPDATRPLNAYQQEDLRRLESELGVRNTPASFTGMGGAGQMAPDVMSRIVDSAFETGVMAQVDFDQLLASQPPQNKQALVDSFRRANITLQADAPSLADSAMGQQQMAANPVQRPEAGFADFRGPAPQISNADLGSQPMMRQTQAQTNVVGQQAYGRSASPVSPAPGIYNVDPQNVAAISQAQRPSKQELYDAEAAKIKAVRDAGPAPVTRQQKLARKTEVANAYAKTQALMDKAYNPKEGVIALASKIKALSADQKESITGYSGYIPSFRASSREADTLIGNLKGVVTGLGKDAAAASGAIGPMAVQEWKIVADMIAKLDLEGMTPRALDAQMNRIIEQVRNATNLAERVYDVQYGDDIKEYPDFKLRGAPSPRAKTPVTKAPPGVSAAEWKAMTPAERKLWQ